MLRLTSKFRPIHHQQLSLKPSYSAQCFQALRSHRKNLRRWALEATTGKEGVQDNLLVRSPRDPDAPDTECLATNQRSRPLASGFSGYVRSHQIFMPCKRTLVYFLIEPFPWSLLNQRKDLRCRSCQILKCRSCQVLKCSIF